jgi:two-component system, OmpR family, sensor histidine kinase KdpD
MKQMSKDCSDAVPGRTFLDPNWPNSYLLALLLIFGATLTSATSLWLIGPRGVSWPIIVALVLIGSWFGLRPALIAAVAAFLAYNFFLVRPRFSFSIAPADVIALGTFFVTALIVGTMAGQLSDRARAVVDQLRRSTTLLAASRELSGATTVADVAHCLARHLKAGGNFEVAIWTADNGRRALLAATEGVAAVCARADADPMSSTFRGRATYTRELKTARGEVGLAAIWGDEGRVAASDADDWLEALLQLGAIALDRAGLAEDISKARLVAEREGLRTALLSSLSHDLRTPIATILAAASSLAEYDTRFEAVTRRELIDTIQTQTERLNRYVVNLLDMTRLESGALDLRRVLIDPVEAMSSALEHMHRRLTGRLIERVFAATGMMISVDPVLIEQALVNILENAVELSPPDSIIHVHVSVENDEAILAVTDQGAGIGSEEMSLIFDKFFRGQADRRKGGGVGLGLTVTKGVVEAFEGCIGVESPVADGRGARFTIRLPAYKAVEANE